MSYIEYTDLVSEFARRTRCNLETVRSVQKSSPDLEVYEVTQLINSMLGLLVFPQQTFIDSIPPKLLGELRGEGWPIPEILGNYPQVKNINQLVKYLLNAITHSNVKFIPDQDKQISGLELWNINSKGRITWRAKVSIDEIEKITEKFTALLL